MKHADWLHAEFDHLVDSATQERAAQHPMSSATSIDKWAYRTNATNFLGSDDQKGLVKHLHSFATSVELRPKESAARGLRNWRFPLSFGHLTISLPSPRLAADTRTPFEDFRLSYKLTQYRPSMAIDARFLRNLQYACQPRLYTQLNIFTQVREQGRGDTYHNNFESGSLADISNAIRAGEISPFRISVDETNLCLFVSHMPLSRRSPIVPANILPIVVCGAVQANGHSS